LIDIQGRAIVRALPTCKLGPTSPCELARFAWTGCLGAPAGWLAWVLCR